MDGRAANVIELEREDEPPRGSNRSRCESPTMVRAPLPALCRSVLRIGALALAAMGGVHAAWAAGAVRPAASDDPAVTQDSGIWDLSFEKGNRRCRLMLRPDPVPGGHALSLPPGCHRAFPSLVSVKSWAAAEGESVVFQTAAGQPVLDFKPSGGPSLTAVAGESDTYSLIPADQARQAALGLVRPDEAAPLPPPAAGPAEAGEGVVGEGALVGEDAPSARVPKRPLPVRAAPARAVSTAEVAGHYAVVRAGKDTGCMVTLEDARTAKAGLKAKLAPACRDQGIVVFDPVGWQVAKGLLLLTAKRGHSAELFLQDDGTWATTPATGRPLVLKRL